MRAESSNDSTRGHPGRTADPLELARAALANPGALLTDLDGTLAPIVDDPASARPVPGAVAALERLAQRLAVVGVITGRAAADARRILGSDRLLIVGNHGLEWLEPGATAALPPPDAGTMRAAVDRAVRAVPRHDGLRIEDKGLSATIHVRGSADPASALARVRAALADADLDGIELRGGRMSIELRPAVAGDKGSAVRAIVRRHAIRGLVVLGDDVTDLDMFRAAAGLRDAGRLAASILAVRGGGEVPVEVERAADAVIDSPREVVELVRALAG